MEGKLINFHPYLSPFPLPHPPQTFLTIIVHYLAGCNIDSKIASEAKLCSVRTNEMVEQCSFVFGYKYIR